MTSSIIVALTALLCVLVHGTLQTMINEGIAGVPKSWTCNKRHWGIEDDQFYHISYIRFVSVSIILQKMAISTLGHS